MWVCGLLGQWQISGICHLLHLFVACLSVRVCVFTYSMCELLQPMCMCARKCVVCLCGNVWLIWSIHPLTSPWMSHSDSGFTYPTEFWEYGASSFSYHKDPYHIIHRIPCSKFMNGYILYITTNIQQNASIKHSLHLKHLKVVGAVQCSKEFDGT